MSAVLDVTPIGPAIDLRRPLLLATGAFVLLFGALGGWAATTVIGGAVIARGEAVVQGRSQLVQHPDGGTVAAIEVQNGDFVEAGQVLLTLDTSLVSVNLDIARQRLAAALALRARLLAEEAGRESVTFTYPTLPEAVAPAPLDTAAEEAGQQEIFAARAEVLRSGQSRLVETLQQIADQIEGIGGQAAATEEQIALLDDEITAQRNLLAQGLARQSQLSDLLRARSELDGRRAAFAADIARLGTQARDAELATEQAKRSFREEVVTALRDATAQIQELILEIATRQGELDRMDVRAPATGIVHELTVTTVGGVVPPGATILQIVPTGESLEFEVRVDPASVDQVHAGQEAELVLSGLDRQSTPRLAARVATVSAAAIPDPQTGRPFYRVDLSVSADEMARLEGAALMPGMPVEAYLATGNHTVLAYLVEPIASHLRRAFRE